MVGKVIIIYFYVLCNPPANKKADKNGDYMSSFEVAHINEQGIDLILVPLKSSFGNQTSDEQNEIIHSLHICAANDDLKGTVIPIWQDSFRRVHFIAPDSYHPFLNSIDYNFVLANLNQKNMWLINNY